MPRQQQIHPYQKKNGGWYYRLRDEFGTRPEPGPFRTKSDAMRHGSRELVRIDDARRKAKLLSADGLAGGRTLRDLMAEFRLLYKGAQSTHDRHWAHLATLESHADPTQPSKLLVDRLLVDLLPADISKFINAYESPHVRMSWCSTWSLLIKMAVQDLRWLTPEQSPRGGIVWPHIDAPCNRAIWRSPSQVARIAMFMREPYCWLPELQALGGLRTCEVLALRPSRIDWKRELVELVHAVRRRSLSPGKLGSLPRTLPLTRALGEVLMSISDETWSDDRDICVADWDGRFLDGSMYAWYWRRAVEASGEEPVEGENLSPYSLRTSHINWQAEAGKVSAADVAKYLGTSIAVIEAYYNRHTDERLLRNARRLDAVFADLASPEA